MSAKSSLPPKKCNCHFFAVTCFGHKKPVQKTQKKNPTQSFQTQITMEVDKENINQFAVYQSPYLNSFINPKNANQTPQKPAVDLSKFEKLVGEMYGNSNANENSNNDVKQSSKTDDWANNPQAKLLHVAQKSLKKKQKEIDELNGELTKVKESEKNLNNQITLQKSILKKQVHSKQKKIEELESQVSEMKTQKEQQDLTVSGLQEKLDSTNKKNEELKAELERAENEVKQDRKLFCELTAQIVSSNPHILMKNQPSLSWQDANSKSSVVLEQLISQLQNSINSSSSTSTSPNSSEVLQFFLEECVVRKTLNDVSLDYVTKIEQKDAQMRNEFERTVKKEITSAKKLSPKKASPKKKLFEKVFSRSKNSSTNASINSVSENSKAVAKK